MRLGLSYYYVGDVSEAARMYSQFLASHPTVSEPDWLKFDLDGGSLALHLDPTLPRTQQDQTLRYGAVVSFTVPDIDEALSRAIHAGFRLVGDVQHRPYGRLAEIRDPWGNRLSLIEPPTQT